MPTKEIRSFFIKACNKINEEMISVLLETKGEYGLFSRNMHAFIHERIDSIFVLIQNGCLWDADIILRSVSEASIKLLFVSLHEANNREKKAIEYWTDLGEINQLKQSKQSQELIDKLKNTNFDPLHIETMVLSEGKLEELAKKWPRKTRQQVTQSWSYNEMVKRIASLTDNKEIECLNRNFTQSSHLIHADETALGVINDRKNRPKEEKIALTVLHERRLLNDCISLYSAPLKAIKNISKTKMNDNTYDAILRFEENSILLNKFQRLITKKKTETD